MSYLGTGFMGKVLIDKLLRVTDIGKIYMLMRVKKGKDQKERLVDTFNNPVSEFYSHLEMIVNDS
jgi:alcohol-forming fatty acyl-CoA reductase